MQSAICCGMATSATTRRDVVKEVVAAVAPHELPLLEGLDDLDDEDVAAVLTGRGRGRDPIRFGVTEASVLLAPVVWIVVSEFVKRGTGIVADGAFARLRALLRRLRNRAPKATPVPRLTPEQLSSVRHRTVEQASEAGIDERTAKQLADAVVSVLARTAAD